MYISPPASGTVGTKDLQAGDYLPEGLEHSGKRCDDKIFRYNPVKRFSPKIHDAARHSLQTIRYTKDVKVNR